MKKKSKWASAITAAALLTTLTAQGVWAAPYHGSIKSQQAPVRLLAEQAGAKVGWNASTSEVTVEWNGQRLVLKIGSNAAKLDGQPITLSEKVELVNGVTQAPLDVFGNVFGIYAVWDDAKESYILIDGPIGDLSSFTPQVEKIESKGAYDLDLKLNEDGLFDVTAKIKVGNLSQQEWEQLVFYMIPNVFTPEERAKLGEFYNEADGQFKIKQVKVGGQDVSYKLDFDTLTLNLGQKQKPAQEVEVEIRYEMKLTINGARIGKTITNDYYLAQWYPMLAVYQNGTWNKKPFNPISESYFTAHSDFKVKYDLPAGYSFASSADQDPAAGQSQGEVSATKSKEFFALVYKEREVATKTVNGVEVRVFKPKNDPSKIEDVLATAANSLAYFQKNIGPYPHQQLDVLMESGGMEYPGIITVGSPQFRMNDPYAIHHTIAHEVAHQWFYGVVSNDPYHEGWIDEGLTEFAATLYDLECAGRKLDQISTVRSYLAQKNDPEGLYPVAKANTPINELQRIAAAYYGQPTFELLMLFEQFGGLQTAKDFLHTYYETYRYKQVTTPEFIRFTETYLPVRGDVFSTWLKQ